MRQLARRFAPLAVLCTGLGFVAVAVASPASADTVTRSFAYTGGEQTFSVPAGVTSVHVVAVGGRGGDVPEYGLNPAADGGAGATVTADLSVTPGHVLYVEVGGNGQYAPTSGQSAAGGFNGGGTSGNPVAASGGGASDVRTGAQTVGGSLDTRLVVAGGGGGATPGGAGGSSAENGSPGGDGTNSQDPVCALGYAGNGGGGGTQSAGGTAGTSPQLGDTGAVAGATGSGGSGGTNDPADPGGGGGGGGLFGGGGGSGGLDCGGGGGGGSSYADPALALDAAYGTDSSGTPSITITYVVPQKPQVVTEPASGLGFTSVTLNGVVNPEGLATTYQFEIRTAGSSTWTLLGSAFPAGSDSTQVAEQLLYSGVSPGTSYDYQLVGTNSQGSTPGGIQSFTTLGGPPQATTEPATAIGQTGATLNGVVNPEGTATNYWFVYGLTPSYGSTTSAGIPLSGGGDPVPVQVVASGLAPGTTYHFALVAQNFSGTTTSLYDQTFTTAPPSPAPTVTTKAATNVGQHDATLNGSVNPNGAATTYHFEWGTTTAYGHSTAALSAGSGTLAKAVHALLSGLPRHTTFHFRLVAVSANGTTDGLDKSFRTL